MIFNKSPNIKRGCEIINYNYFFPLIGICVSYNYMDTLKFMLPINYRHFSKIYIVTQKTDISTINFSRKFDNVKVVDPIQKLTSTDLNFFDMSHLTPDGNYVLASEVFNSLVVEEK